MTRIIVDIPENQLKKIDDLARRNKTSRSEIIRRAVSEYLQRMDGHFSRRG